MYGSFLEVVIIWNCQHYFGVIVALWLFKVKWASIYHQNDIASVVYG